MPTMMSITAAMATPGTHRSPGVYDRNRCASQPRVNSKLATNTTAAVSKIGSGAVSEIIISG